jgi:hypothetical protein
MGYSLQQNQKGQYMKKEFMTMDGNTAAAMASYAFTEELYEKAQNNSQRRIDEYLRLAKD